MVLDCISINVFVRENPARIGIVIFIHESNFMRIDKRQDNSLK